jgi:hypothetical protein
MGRDWLKNKTFEEVYGSEKSELIRHKISSSLKGKATGKGKTEESEARRREKISLAKSPNFGGYRRGSGRGKKGWYKGYWCDSSWELAWIIYQLDHNVLFKRNYQKFKYTYNGVEKNWMPDFILDDGSYVEIKGYLTEQVRHKLRSFTKDLCLITEKEMKDILMYVTDKYGKNFILEYTEV